MTIASCTLEQARLHGERLSAGSLGERVKLQLALDELLLLDTGTLGALNFSLTVADPALDGCPLVGCSAGFLELCGFKIEEVLGRNCRFLLDRVPAELLDSRVRLRTREFCDCVARGELYTHMSDDNAPWLDPNQQTRNAMFCVQVNARKDGTLFNSMFYLKEVRVEGKPYILGLQAALPDAAREEGWENREDDNDKSLQALRHACVQLNKRMAEVERLLASVFWFSSALRRLEESTDDGPSGDEGQDEDMDDETEKEKDQEVEEPKEGCSNLLNRGTGESQDEEEVEGTLRTHGCMPGVGACFVGILRWPLSLLFSTTAATRALSALGVEQQQQQQQQPQRRTRPGKCSQQQSEVVAITQQELNLTLKEIDASVACWDPKSFSFVKTLATSQRNHGMVDLMRSQLDGGTCVAVRKMPNSWVKTSPNLFAAAHPGTTAEWPWHDLAIAWLLDCKTYPHGCQLRGIFRDHEHTYVARSLASKGDLFQWCQQLPPPGSLEREAVVILLVKQIIEAVALLHEFGVEHRDISLENLLLTGDQQVKIIDFGMATVGRRHDRLFRGKTAYQAPELHEQGMPFDAFIADAFSVGIATFALALNDYPWSTTARSQCRNFDFACERGFHDFMKRWLQDVPCVDCSISEQLLQLLGGLLRPNPIDRLTLGEAAFECCGVSVRPSAWDLL
mmetsp:Transcript_105591/g.204450  ORF Transcript_105591/g.204450 Transcript_105591/m.204450 type:complete len:679 (+) Transcript_105591:31-2067(+)